MARLLASIELGYQPQRLRQLVRITPPAELSTRLNVVSKATRTVFSCPRGVSRMKAVSSRAVSPVLELVSDRTKRYPHHQILMGLFALDLQFCSHVYMGKRAAIYSPLLPCKRAERLAIAEIQHFSVMTRLSEFSHRLSLPEFSTPIIGHSPKYTES
jgi:hypothetical protein